MDLKRLLKIWKSLKARELMYTVPLDYVKGEFYESFLQFCPRLKSLYVKSYFARSIMASEIYAHILKYHNFAQ